MGIGWSMWGRCRRSLVDGVDVVAAPDAGEQRVDDVGEALHAAAMHTARAVGRRGRSGATETGEGKMMFSSGGPDRTGKRRGEMGRWEKEGGAGSDKCREIGKGVSAGAGCCMCCRPCFFG